MGDTVQPKQMGMMDAMVEALRRAFTSKSPEEARAGAQAIANRLPGAVMPHDALARKRQQMADMDRMLQEADR